MGVAGVVLLVLFVLVERRAAEPNGERLEHALEGEEIDRLAAAAPGLRHQRPGGERGAIHRERADLAARRACCLEDSDIEPAGCERHRAGEAAGASADHDDTVTAHDLAPI